MLGKSRPKIPVRPAPATLVEERGAAHGFSKKQLRRTREQMGIIAFRLEGVRDELRSDGEKVIDRGI